MCGVCGTRARGRKQSIGMVGSGAEGKSARKRDGRKINEKEPA